MAQVRFRIDAKRTRFRVHHRHLDKSARNDERNNRADEVAQNNAGAGQLNRHSAAEKEADANRAADREHRQLALIELSTKFLRSVDGGRSDGNLLLTSVAAAC